MSGLPKVAIVIANRNYAQWVLDCIKSAINQDYAGEIRVIVVDDGSTDNSVEIITRDYSNSIDLLEFDTNPDLSTRLGHGLPTARNLGIKYAKDRYDPDVFMMLDSDDEYKPNKVSQSVKVWLEAPDAIGAVYADYYILGQNDYLKEEYKPAFSYRRLLKENIVHSGSLISKQALNAVGLYDENLPVCDDYDMWIRIGQKFVIKHIPMFLMNVRATGINLSHITEKNKHVWENAFKYLREKHGKKLHSKN